MSQGITRAFHEYRVTCAQKAISNKVQCFIFAWGYAHRRIWHNLIEGAVIYATEERLADRTEMSASRRVLDSFEVIRVSLGQRRLDKGSPYLPEAQSCKAKGHLVQSLSWTVGNIHLRDIKNNTLLTIVQGRTVDWSETPLNKKFPLEFPNEQSKTRSKNRRLWIEDLFGTLCLMEIRIKTSRTLADTIRDILHGEYKKTLICLLRFQFCLWNVSSAFMKGNAGILYDISKERNFFPKSLVASFVLI